LLQPELIDEFRDVIRPIQDIQILVRIRPADAGTVQSYEANPQFLSCICHEEDFQS
jgi:hypothetical protein